jgi:Domain of unknown function (DUF4326)
VSPRRLRRSRKMGVRTPDGVIYVGFPSKWASPYAPGDALPDGGRVRDAAHAVRLYAEYLTERPWLVEEAKRELRGRDLMCWCPLTEPSCHAEVLLRVANHETLDRSPFDPLWARPITVGGAR